MDETDVLDFEISLPLFPLYRPSQVGFVELLPQFGDFNRIGRRKENIVSHRLTQHHAVSLLPIIHWGSRHVVGLTGRRAAAMRGTHPAPTTPGQM
jgi:hypothetical protein